MVPTTSHRRLCRSTSIKFGGAVNKQSSSTASTSSLDQFLDISSEEETLSRCDVLPDDEELAAIVDSFSTVALLAPECLVPTYTHNVTKAVIERGRSSIFRRSLWFSSLSGESFAGGLSMRRVQRRFKHRLLLIDGVSDEPLVVVVEKFDKATAKKAYDVYGRLPLFLGARAGLYESGSPFYRWYRIEDSRFSLVDRTVRVATGGNTFQDLWMITAVKGARNQLLISTADDSHPVGTLVEGDTGNWQLSIAPGTDPALILIIAGVVAEDETAR